MDKMQTEKRNLGPRNNVMCVEKEMPEEAEHKNVAQGSHACNFTYILETENSRVLCTN